MDLKLLEQDKFILLRPGLNARMIADRYFADAGFRPRILMECNGGMIASQLVKDGLIPLPTGQGWYFPVRKISIWIWLSSI